MKKPTGEKSRQWRRKQQQRKSISGDGENIGRKRHRREIKPAISQLKYQRRDSFSAKRKRRNRKRRRRKMARNGGISWRRRALAKAWRQAQQSAAALIMANENSIMASPKSATSP